MSDTMMAALLTALLGALGSALYIVMSVGPQIAVLRTEVENLKAALRDIKDRD
jgi:uncharacterized small protein (DUF1192 family)